MLPFRCLTVVFILMSLSSVCLTYRVRRSGLAGYDDPYALTNALQAIDRERRRSNYRSRLQQDLFDDEDDSYFNPDDVPDIDEDYIRTLEYLEDRNEPEYYPKYNVDRSPSRSYPRSFGDLRSKEYGPIKRTTYHPHRVAPSYDQLRDIFGDANIPRKRMAPALVPELMEGEANVMKAEKDTRQLAQHMSNLLEKAEKVTEKEVVKQIDGNPPETIKDVKVEKTNPDGTTTTLEEIFEGADTNSNTEDDKEDTENEKEENIETSSDLSDTTGDDATGQTKTKRASSEPCKEEAAYIGDLLQEIARLRKQLSALEVEQVLEDKENDYLANALVYSTLDQMTGGNQYVNEEYNDISKATKTEKLIQTIADGTSIENPDVMDAAQDKIDDYLDPTVEDTVVENIPMKRSEEEEMKWYDHPVQESVSGAHMAQTDDASNDDNFLAGETPIDIPYPDEIEDEEETEEEEQEAEEREKEEAEREVLETAVAEVENEIEEANEEASKIETLRSLVKGLSATELKELLIELQDAELAEDAGDKVVYTCPAVAELSENCAFADAIGIPIDADARDLCIRHQLCYTCGVELGISSEGCDRGYKETVISECEGDSRCLKSAAVFLKFMTEYHSYALSGPQQCSAPCLEEFIIGEE